MFLTPTIQVNLVSSTADEDLATYYIQCCIQSRGKLPQAECSKQYLLFRTDNNKQYIFGTLFYKYSNSILRGSTFCQSQLGARESKHLGSLYTNISIAEQNINKEVSLPRVVSFLQDSTSSFKNNRSKVSLFNIKFLANFKQDFRDRSRTQTWGTKLTFQRKSHRMAQRTGIKARKLLQQWHIGFLLHIG